MRGLFFKVFVILWIAQSLIFVISTALIVRHHFDSPDVLFDALPSSLHIEARESMSTFESGVSDRNNAAAGTRALQAGRWGNNMFGACRLPPAAGSDTFSC